MLAEKLKAWLASQGIDIRRNPFVNPQRLQRHLITRDDAVVFDIGAHVGQTSLAYRAMFPQASIHAFEPFPASLARLEQALAHDPRVQIHALALSNQATEQTLFANAVESTNSLMPISEGADEHWGEGRLKAAQPITVKTETLDGFCQRQGIDRIDIMKIDVQGAEYQVLEGASDLLARQAIGLLQFEFILADTYRGQRPLQDYLSLMDAHQYELVDFFQPIRRNGRLLQADLMFAAPGIRVA